MNENDICFWWYNFIFFLFFLFPNFQDGFYQFWNMFIKINFNYCSLVYAMFLGFKVFTLHIITKIIDIFFSANLHNMRSY